MLKSTPEQIKKYLAAHVSSSRYQHILGTWDVAQDLADRYRVSQEKTMCAALLHDAGKCMPSPAMVRYVQRHRLIVPQKTAVINFNPSLLHAHVSAHIARTVFGVTDREVLDAICLHTVGGPAMSTLAKIIYLSDATSPDRRRPGVRQLRWMCKRDLDKAMLMAIAEKTHHVLLKKKWLHPQAAAAWNYFVAAVRSREIIT